MVGSPPSETEILVVDDNAANLLAFEAVLEPLGVPVVRAESGDQALQHILARGDSISVMLLDVHMPGLDGFETAHLIRSRESLRHLPIIFVTAVRREEAHIVKGYAEGAVDYVVKPFNPDALRAKVAFFVDVHRRSASLGKTRLVAEQRLALALDASGLGVWDWDPTDTQVRCDARSAALLETRPDARITLATLGLPTIDETNTTEPLAAEITTSSGRCLHVRARAFGNGSVVRLVGIIADITDEKRSQRERAMFVGVLGHDLRNPLGAIALQTHMLEQHDDPNVVKAADRIGRSAHRMASLVDDMLDFVGSQHGPLPITVQATNLDDICRDVIEDVRANFPERAIELAPGNRDGGVWDRGRIAQVVQNLVANAARHSSDGTTITVSVREEPGDLVCVEVRNEGAPIPDEVRRRMFEPFVSGGGGIGLGLFITKRLIDAHGGSLSVDSNNGYTAFRVTLPRVVPSTPRDG